MASIKVPAALFHRFLGHIRSQAQGSFASIVSYPVSRNVLCQVANGYHKAVGHSAQKWGGEIVEAVRQRAAATNSWSPSSKGLRRIKWW